MCLFLFFLLECKPLESRSCDFANEGTGKYMLIDSFPSLISKTDVFWDVMHCLALL